MPGQAPIRQALAIVARVPTFLGFGALGALALRLARKPAPKIGYSSRYAAPGGARGRIRPPQLTKSVNFPQRGAYCHREG